MGCSFEDYLTTSVPTIPASAWLGMVQRTPHVPGDCTIPLAHVGPASVRTGSDRPVVRSVSGRRDNGVGRGETLRIPPRT